MSGEVRWHKSSRSSDQGGACVEMVVFRCVCEEYSRVIAVRDSKDPDGAALSCCVKAGTLDLS